MKVSEWNGRIKISEFERMSCKRNRAVRDEGRMQGTKGPTTEAMKERERPAQQVIQFMKCNWIDAAKGVKRFMKSHSFNSLKWKAVNNEWIEWSVNEWDLTNGVLKRSVNEVKTVRSEGDQWKLTKWRRCKPYELKEIDPAWVNSFSSFHWI